MTAQFCPLLKVFCGPTVPIGVNGPDIDVACAWWDAALDKCMVVAINDLMHSMYGGERADH